MAMTEKQKKFAHEYLIDLNATQAAIRAGYSEDTARQIACENLTKVYIQEYIAELRQKQQERTQITADKVLQQAARLAFSDIRDYYDDNGIFKGVHSLTDDAATALASIKSDEITVNKKKIGVAKEIKLYDKSAAIDKLMKHLGLYKEDNIQTKAVISIKIE